MEKAHFRMHKKAPNLDKKSLLENQADFYFDDLFWR